MKYEINDHIINSTIECNGNFSCLSGDNKCFCEIADRVGEVIFVNYDDSKIICNYRGSFGSSSICHCPTRKEIYNHYRK